MAIDYLKPMKELLRIGWIQYAIQKSPFNAAVSYTYANAITGSYPDFSIDPSKMLISRGTLPSSANASANIVSRTIHFKWNVDSGSITDRALLAVVNRSGFEAVFDIESACRKDKMQSLIIPAKCMGEEVDAYLGFVSENGKEVANSIYLGSITVI